MEDNIAVRVGEAVNNRYKINREMARGRFGIIYEGYDTAKKRRVVLKFEKNKERLANEFKLYKVLERTKASGFPKVYWYGKFEKTTTYCLVMQYLGPNLMELHGWCKEHFTLATIARIAIQLLYRLESFHELGYLHSDIKPENICVGMKERKDEHTLHLIDLGSATKYLKKDGTHVEGKSKDIKGYNQYSPLRMHYGYLQCRRDELQSLGYTLLYFYHGSLPWQEMTGETEKEKWKKVRNSKKQYEMTGDLKDDLPTPFADYFKYVESVQFEKKPDYQILRALFRCMFDGAEQHPDETKPYCWNNEEEYEIKATLSELELDDVKIGSIKEAKEN